MSGDRQAKVTLTGDASGVTAAAQQAAKGLDAVAAAADKAADHQAAAAAAAGAYSKAAAAAGQAGAAGASGIAAGARAMGAARVSAAQTAQAFGQLPMQFQDIAVSLAGGMNPLMVMAQQLPQITSSFGGVREAFRAIASTLTPVSVGLGGMAAALALASSAAVAGYRESQAYTDAITMTGNAAGVTQGHLNEMAQRATALGVSQSAAADALAKATASGRIGAENLAQVGVLAARMERNVGVAVDATIKLFADLAKKPAEASRALNEQYNYLDLATYKRIAALEEQGKFEEAAALAQGTFADAMDDRMGRIEGNLGTLEKAWRAVTSEASDAWNSMMGLGRAETTEDRISELGKVLARSRASGSWDKFFDLRSGGQKQAMEDRLQQEQFDLQERVRMERLEASVQGQIAAANREAIRAAAEAEKEAKRRAEELRRKGEQAARQAAREAEQERKAQRDAEVAGLAEAARTKVSFIEDEIRTVGAAMAAGRMSEEAAYAQRIELTKAKTEAQIQALEAQNKALAQQKLKGADDVKRNQEIAQNAQEIARLWMKGAADQQVIADQETSRLRDLTTETQKYRAELDALLATKQREVGVSALSDEERDRAARAGAVDGSFQERLFKLNAERGSRKLPESEYQERLAALNQYYTEAKALESRFQAEQQAIRESGTAGLQRGFDDWAKSARDNFSQVRDASRRAFDNMADALADTAMTGKLSFSEFADSVIRDILRIVIRGQLLKMFEGAMGGGWGSIGDLMGRAYRSFTGTGNMSESSTGAKVYHGGGVVGKDTPYAIRMQPASAWNNAPRFHAGLATDEMRAILKRNESVLTPEQMKQLAPVGAMGAAPRMDIRLINESGTPLQASETRQRSDGGFDVILQAAEAHMADRIGAGVGPVVGAMRGRFGLRDALV